MCCSTGARPPPRPLGRIRGGGRPRRQRRRNPQRLPPSREMGLGSSVSSGRWWGGSRTRTSPIHRRERTALVCIQARANLGGSPRRQRPILPPCSIRRGLGSAAPCLSGLRMASVGGRGNERPTTRLQVGPAHSLAVLAKMPGEPAHRRDSSQRLKICRLRHRRVATRSKPPGRKIMRWHMLQRMVRAEGSIIWLSEQNIA